MVNIFGPHWPSKKFALVGLPLFTTLCNGVNIVQILIYRATCLQKFLGLDFRDILHPDTVSDVDHDFIRTLNYFDFFRRAVHVQSFQSPCTCTARRVLPSDFTPFRHSTELANQELQNAFLDESLAEKEPKL